MSRKRGFQAIGSVIVPLLALLLVGAAWAAPRATSTRGQEPLAKPTAVSHDYFDGNTINSTMTNDGLIVDHRLTGASGMEWPKGTGNTIDYASGLWLVGIGHDDGIIYTACAEYASELVAGPIGGNHLDEAYRIYKINKGEEGTGDWLEWPVDQGAPVDENGDPAIIGDQTLWWVCNDGNVAQHANVFSTSPMDVEVHIKVFGFNRADPMGNIMFVEWKFIHKGDQQMDSCFVALWDDPDLGDASDDLVGCDTTLGLGYCYNGFPTDSYYGATPPALGFDFFQGPEVEGEYLSMTAFAWYYNGAPDPFDDPEIGSEAYWFMNGYAGDGTPYTDHEGNPTQFAFAGDPVAGTGHLDGEEVGPGDRRFLMSSGPFTLAPGDTQYVLGAKIIAPGTNNISAVAALRFFDGFAQNAYDNNFVLPSPPGPEVEVTSLDQEIVLTWQDGCEDVEAYDFSGYKFQGYNVYQGASAAGPWTRLETFDIVDDYGIIFDKTFDAETGLVLDKPVAWGTNSGIQRYLTIDNDVLTQTPLDNYRRYYFVVTTYAFNEDPAVAPRIVESALDAITIFPQEKFEQEPVGIVGDTVQVSHDAGGSDGIITPIVIDPLAVTGDDYKITFLITQVVDDHGDTVDATAWRLTNTTTNTVLLDDQLNQTNDEDYQVVEGLLVKVAGPPLAMNDWDYSDTRWFSWVNAGMSGFGGAVGLGVEFFGSTLTAADYKTVEIRFSSTEQTNCKVYRRDLGYAVQPGLGTFPGSAWDVDADPARRLNICFVEYDDPGVVKPANMIWDPSDADDGGREYLFIMNSDYDAVTAGGYGDDDPMWGPGADVLWAYWPRLRPPHPYLETEGTWTLIPNYVNSTSDVFSFTAPDAPTTGDDVEKANLDKINVVPNPYFAFNPQERLGTERFVTFTHLPNSGVTIRIFTLDGTLVRIIDDDARAEQETIDTPMAEWDLRNEGNVPVASGMYIAFIEVDGVGEKILKLAVFMPEERLEFF
jgi:hypothetical protein